MDPQCLEVEGGVGLKADRSQLQPYGRVEGGASVDGEPGGRRRRRRPPFCPICAICARFRLRATPPLRPAARASADVNSCAVPLACARWPPLRAISCRCAASKAAKPRGRFSLMPRSQIAPKRLPRLAGHPLRTRNGSGPAGHSTLCRAPWLLDFEFSPPVHGAPLGII